MNMAEIPPEDRQPLVDPGALEAQVAALDQPGDAPADGERNRGGDRRRQQRRRGILGGLLALGLGQ